LLNDIVKKKLLTANAVFGLFPANSRGDDIIIYQDEKRQQIKNIFHTLRQQVKQSESQSYSALADFIAPEDSGIKDYIGCFAVTAGIGIEALIKKFEDDHDDYKSIMTKALADRLAEAFAEHLHQLVRKEYWGYAADEDLDNEALIKCQYQGIRPAPGYPACPDHTEKDILFDLLSVKKNTDITLTENYAMLPAASVCGLYFTHPQSRYFNLGKLGHVRD